jgi:DNA repair protein RecO (recombination protein O)
MSRTYQTTGINLKSSPIGEADRLVTILTSDYGLIRVIAPGARKPKSSLGGRS